MDRKELEKRLIEIRRELHSSAECGFNLPRTLAIIKEVLSRENIKYKSCGRAGLTVDLGEGDTKILLRADIDALPIEEKTGLTYAAKNGNMHACGHDLHTAMLLGAALILNEGRAHLVGGVRLVFQPAEEELSGVRDMLSAGLLSDIQPSIALALHVGVGENMMVGRVIVPGVGESSTAAKYFKISLFGKSAHGAMPALGVDALLAAADLRMMLADRIDGRDGVLTVGIIRGGEGAGVIADYAELSGSMRAENGEALRSLEKRVKGCLLECESRHRVSSSYAVKGEAPPLKISRTAREQLIRAVGLTEGASLSLPEGSLGGGSDDFAYISRLTPSAYAVLGAGDGGGYPLHNPRAVFDEGCIMTGARLLSNFALSYGN